MNRLSFLKTLGVGIAAVVITPKILIETSEPPLRTGGVIPFLAKGGGRKGYDLEKPAYFDDLSKRYGYFDILFPFSEK